MARYRRNYRGNATIEFTLVGIPIIFGLISVVEMSRGMWIYHSLNHAVKEGVRYTVVRGVDNPNANHATRASVCQTILQAGGGLLAQDLTLTLHSATAADYTATAATCLGDSTLWPPAGQDAQGFPIKVDDNPGQAISIQATYPFQSAIAMFWPGAGRGQQFPTFNLPADSREVMQY